MPISRGIFPGTFTMGTVVFGFLSILSSFEGNVTTACWFIILAGFLDALDGKVARLSGASSQFGIELDSLADFLAFGVAPAVVVHTIKLSSLGKWGWIISIIYIMASSYRLARFNVLADSDEKKDFFGLPVPVAAFGLVTYIIFSYNIWGALHYDRILISMVVLFAFLMVSQVQYDMIPEKFSSKGDRAKLIFVLVSVIAIVFQPRLLLFPIVAAYILYGMIRELYRLMGASVDRVAHRNSKNGAND